MPTTVARKKDFLSVLDFDAADLENCLALAAQVKADRSLGRHAPTADALDGRHVALLFDKPSLRTRTTFEIAVRELGGHIVPLQPDVALGCREPVADVARNLERWVDGVVIRTFSQKVLQEFAASARRLHVVNALTDEEHPCQAIADFLTLRERLGLGTLRGRTIAYVGDGNNVATSLVHAAAMLGVHVHVASPESYQLPHSVVQQATSVARHGARLRLFNEAIDAVAGVDAVYTDTWTSMGQEAEADVRRRVFAPFQVNEDVMAAAGPGALFMHCLPAHRGEEVTSDVFESDVSVVFDQAENRLHGQKALLLMLLATTVA
ncbi:MAG: ornithine carbamoyltransferase [Acidobacteria bacterium]|nr:MAG: ornithine carbamoyltransferase [Acidobacteriota bacterium]PYQ85856.1 MAG: ornithine carbamoyltransferase [Acidobacteriota bacterium]PYR08717.1 MAG: ornithine carbamoyltransferase [Acidobacteriota bacterium]